MKYAFIERHRRIWPICVQCRVLKVSVSGFHQHRARRRKIADRRHLSDEALLTHISAVYAEHRSAYGWPRIWRELVKPGIRVGKQRVQRLMQQHGIRARGKRRFRVVTTDSRPYHDINMTPVSRFVAGAAVFSGLLEKRLFWKTDGANVCQEIPQFHGRSCKASSRSRQWPRPSRVGGRRPRTCTTVPGEQTYSAMKSYS